MDTPCQLQQHGLIGEWRDKRRRLFSEVLIMSYWVKKKCKDCGKEITTTPHGRNRCSECWNNEFFKRRTDWTPLLIVSPASHWKAK